MLASYGNINREEANKDFKGHEEGVRDTIEGLNSATQTTKLINV